MDELVVVFLEELIEGRGRIRVRHDFADPIGFLVVQRRVQGYRRPGSFAIELHAGYV